MTCSKEIDWCHKEGEIYNRAIDFTYHMATGDTLDSVTWAVNVGMTSAGDGFNDTLTTCWFGGGTAGNTYVSTCTADTTFGERYIVTINYEVV